MCTPILYCKKWDGSHSGHKKVHDFQRSACVSIVVVKNSPPTEHCAPRGRSASKIYAPDPQHERPSPPISQGN